MPPSKGLENPVLLVNEGFRVQGQVPCPVSARKAQLVLRSIPPTVIALNFGFNRALIYLYVFLVVPPITGWVIDSS